MVTRNRGSASSSATSSVSISCPNSRRRAAAGLLDTYEAERQPVAAWVLNWTRAQVALMLFTVPGAMNRVVALSSGIEQHYDVAADASPPVGSIAGDVDLASGVRLADHARDGRFALVDRSPGPARPSLLVRPDGVIIWAAPEGDGPPGSDAGQLLEAEAG